MSSIIILVTGILLAILAWIDVKTKTVPVVLIGVLALFLALTGFYIKLSIPFMVFGCIPGMVALFITYVTKGKLGKGDGLILLALGIGCGLDRVMLVWGIALTMAAVTGIVLLVLKRATRKTELPFVPFLFWGYVVCQWIRV